MARRGPVVAGEVGWRCSELIIDVTWEIPIEVVVVSGDGRVRGLSDEVSTVLIDILEHE